MITLPAGTPAQVRSWLIDYNNFKSKGQMKSANVMAAKIEKYLEAVESAGSVLQPPVTQAEKDVANFRRNRALVGSSLEFRSNY